MEEIQNETQTDTSVSPDVTSEIVEPVESDSVSPKKVRVVPLIILGLVISLILAGVGTLIWKSVTKKQEADLVINVPTKVTTPTVNPTPTGETSTLIPEDIAFEPELYRNELAGFEIGVPLGWQIDDSGKSGALLVLVNPKAITASGSAFLTFISVTSGVRGNSLDEEITSSKEGLAKQFTSYVVEEDKELSLAGHTYHLLGGSYMINDIKMKNRNIITIFKDRGYAVSATSPESSWPSNETVLNACLFSFKTL